MADDSAEPTRVDSAAERLVDLTQRTLDGTREPVWGEREWDDEDPLRDVVTAVERFRHWQATGDHGFLELRPGLEPNVAWADQVYVALGPVLRYWDEYGPPLDPGLVAETDAALAEYYEIRQEEGGPGLVNARTWAR